MNETEITDSSKTEDIRQISNVIQALENLITQCGTKHIGLRMIAEDHLDIYKETMRQKIHG